MAHLVKGVCWEITLPETSSLPLKIGQNPKWTDHLQKSLYIYIFIGFHIGVGNLHAFFRAEFWYGLDGPPTALASVRRALGFCLGPRCGMPSPWTWKQNFICPLWRLPYAAQHRRLGDGRWDGDGRWGRVEKTMLIVVKQTYRIDGFSMIIVVKQTYRRDGFWKNMWWKCDKFNSCFFCRFHFLFWKDVVFFYVSVPLRVVGLMGCWCEKSCNYQFLDDWNSQTFKT